MRCWTLLSLLLYLLLVSCGDGDVAGTTSETDIGIIGSIKDENGGAVAGATVIVYKKEEGALPVPVDTVTTDNQGGYFVEVTSSGVYSLGGSHTNDSGTFKAALGEVTVDSTVHAGDTLELGDDVLVTIGGLSGVVKLSTAATPTVLVSVKGTPYSVLSDNLGNYSLSDIPVSNNYTLTFEQSGYKGKELDAVQVVGGVVTPIADTVTLLSIPVIYEPTDGAVDVDSLLFSWNDCGDGITYKAHFTRTHVPERSDIWLDVEERTYASISNPVPGSSWECYVVAFSSTDSATGPAVSFTLKK